MMRAFGRSSFVFAFAIAASLVTAGCPPLLVDDDDGYGYSDDPCDDLPNLYVDRFTFTDSLQDGTHLAFQEIVFCNDGYEAADWGFGYEVFLSKSVDPYDGMAFLAFSAVDMPGISSGECVGYEQGVAAGSAVEEEGYYYVFVAVDNGDDIYECYEDDNWARSDEAIYIVPSSAETL